MLELKSQLPPQPCYPLFIPFHVLWLPWWLSGQESTGSAGDTWDTGLIPASGRSPAGGHGNPLHYSCLENLMDRGDCWATVPGVTKSRTRLSDFSSLHFTSQRDQMPGSYFSECGVLSWLFHSPPPSSLIKRLFSSSLLSAVTVVSFAIVRFFKGSLQTWLRVSVFLH